MTDDIRFDMHCSINRVEKLINSKILWSKNNEIYINSVLTEVLINLRDLLYKSDKFLKKRVSFKDDITEDLNLKIFDITDLIRVFRDCCCHNDTDKLQFSNGNFKISFNKITSKEKFLIIDGKVIENKYDDDIAFNMGCNVLYLKRHIERSFSEIKDNFKPYDYQ